MKQPTLCVHLCCVANKLKKIKKIWRENGGILQMLRPILFREEEIEDICESSSEKSQRV